VQKPHVFEAPRNTFPNEHLIPHLLYSSSTRLAGREEGWPQHPPPWSLLDSSQKKLLHQGKATQAEPGSFSQAFPPISPGAQRLLAHNLAFCAITPRRNLCFRHVCKHLPMLVSSFLIVTGLLTGFSKDSSCSFGIIQKEKYLPILICMLYLKINLLMSLSIQPE